jgi:hypothetical protein
MALKTAQCNDKIRTLVLDTKSAKSTKAKRELDLGQAALEGEENEIGAAAHAKLVEKIRNVKLHSAFRDVELAGDFLVGEIFKKRIENFLLAAAEIGDGIRFQAAALPGEDGIHETGEELAWNPEASAGDQREGTNQLIPRFDVGEKALHTKAQERKTVGFVVLFADHDQTGFGMAFKNIGEERPGGGLRGMRVNHVNLRLGRLEITQVRRKRGFQLLGDDFERRLRENALKLAQHQWVRREDANRQFGGCPFRSHCLPA